MFFTEDKEVLIIYLAFNIMCKVVLMITFFLL